VLQATNSTTIPNLIPISAPASVLARQKPDVWNDFVDRRRCTKAETYQFQAMMIRQQSFVAISHHSLGLESIEA